VETIFVLLPLALLIAAIAVGFFIWAARSGQFDDLDTPAVRILFDDPPSPRPRASQATERGFGETSPPSPRASPTADEATARQAGVSSTRRVSG
jgi:cbb3-type cytochrome oxidase maturation protein